MTANSEKSFQAQVNAVAAAYGVTEKEAHDLMLTRMQIRSNEDIAARNNAATLQAAQTRAGVDQFEANLRYAAGQAKIAADDVDALMKFAQANPLLTPPQAVEQYKAMKASYSALNKIPVSETPPAVILPPKK